MANITFNDVLPWALGAAGLLAAHYLLTSRLSDPELSAASNTIDYPNFPGVGTDPHNQITGIDPQVAFPHPYAHPIISRYIGAPAYFQNSIQLDDTHYNNGEWQGQQIPPINTTVSQNMPTNETYSHHHFYFDQEREDSPIDMGILKNIT